VVSQLVYIIVSSILGALGTVVSAMLLTHLRHKRVEEAAKIKLDERRDKQLRDHEREIGIIKYYLRKKKILPTNGAEVFGDSTDIRDY